LKFEHKGTVYEIKEFVVLIDGSFKKSVSANCVIENSKSEKRYTFINYALKRYGININADCVYLTEESKEKTND
jgi:hypothetical protein